MKMVLDLRGHVDKLHSIGCTEEDKSVQSCEAIGVLHGWQWQKRRKKKSKWERLKHSSL